MYDTIYLNITEAEAGGVDFLSEIPCYLERVSEHNYSGHIILSGCLNGLKVSASRYQVKVKGSICKYYLNDNLQTMGRGDTQRAFERLSDELHLPMSLATVHRVDVGQNFIMKSPTDVYLNHLGMLQNYKRCPMIEAGTLYYTKRDEAICFYDKVKESRQSKEPIPELYQGRNVLRYEQRYIKRVASSLNVPEVTGSMLYDTTFYKGLISFWKDGYFAIKKINDITLNFQAMKTKQELYKMGVLSLIERAGGEMEMIAQINEACKRGDLSKKQAFDLRRAVADACKQKEGLVTKNDCICELDKKVLDAIKFYR